MPQAGAVPLRRSPAGARVGSSGGSADHPKTINLREDVLRAAINQWIGRLFDREHIDETVRALVDSQANGTTTSDHEASKRRLAEAKQALSRFQDAIAAGVDPTALEAINKAKAQRDAIRAELANQPKASVLDTAEVYAMIDSLGDVGAVIEQAGRTTRANEWVRGATCILATRFELRA